MYIPSRLLSLAIPNISFLRSNSRSILRIPRVSRRWNSDSLEEKKASSVTVKNNDPVSFMSPFCPFNDI